MFSRAVLLSFFLATAGPMGAFAAFSYDPTNLEIGPAKWGELPIEGNVCNGQSNSPIAVESMACTKFEDYKFTVSTLIKLFLNVLSYKTIQVSDAPARFFFSCIGRKMHIQ
jgi:carbonic anhydrase